MTKLHFPPPCLAVRRLPLARVPQESVPVSWRSGEAEAAQWVVNVTSVLPRGLTLPGQLAFRGATSNLLASGEVQSVALTPKRIAHILHGEFGTGGHLWPGGAGKTCFPQEWDEEKIIRVVSEIANDPRHPWGRFTPDGKNTSEDRTYYSVVAEREGIWIRLFIAPKGEGVLTAFPLPTPEHWTPELLSLHAADLVTDPSVDWHQLSGRPGRTYTEGGSPARFRAEGEVGGNWVVVEFYPAVDQIHAVYSPRREEQT